MIITCQSFESPNRTTRSYEDWAVLPNMPTPTPPQPLSVSVRQTFSGVDLNGAEPGSIAPPLSDSLRSLLCRSACSPLCELGLDQVPDQTPIALCER
jgi:hypothetical protein